MTRAIDPQAPWDRVFPFQTDAMLQGQDSRRKRRGRRRRELRVPDQAAPDRLMKNFHFDSDSTALFLDIDGTLLDIAARPDDVSVPTKLKTELQWLTGRLGGALALISGRSVRDIDRLFGELKPRASGCHGGELRLLPAGEVFMAASGRLPPSIIDNLTKLAASHSALLLEDKGVCVAVHYRAAPTLGAALRHELDTIIARSGEAGLTVLPGRLVYEIKRDHVDKGTAVDAFMRLPAFSGRQPVFIGDDITDMAAFSAVTKYHGRPWSVGRDLAPAVRMFDDASDVRAWITAQTARQDTRAGRAAAPRYGT